jgi:hypothetical protein
MPLVEPHTALSNLWWKNREKRQCFVLQQSRTTKSTCWLSCTCVLCTVCLVGFFVLGVVLAGVFPDEFSRERSMPPVEVFCA